MFVRANQMGPNSSFTKMERLKSLLATSEFADCTFIIDGTNIEAHKLILTCSSPVFEKMFYGEMASNRVVITDINLDDFKQMLEFVYTDNVSFGSVLNAWSLFYVAHKYLLSDFINVCTAYIEKNLTISNLVLSYEYAEIYELDELKMKCLCDIGDYVRGIFNNDADYHMKPTTLLAILQRHSLNIENDELVRAIVQWAVTECDTRNVDVSPKSIMKLLDDLEILPFMVHLETKSLTHGVVPLLKFTTEMLQNLRNTSKPRRKYVKKHWSTFCKSRQMYKIARRIKLCEEDKFLSLISVNCRIVLFGLVVMTEDEVMSTIGREYNGEITVEVREEHNPILLMKSTYIGRFPYETPCYVPLSDLITLDMNKVYAIQIRYKNLDLNNRKGSILCYYISSKLVDEKKNVIISFDEMNGSVLKGICYYPA